MLELAVREVHSSNVGLSVILTSSIDERVVPIFVGPIEAQTISMILSDENSSRPSTQDLLFEITASFDIRLEKAVIDRFHQGIVFAQLYFYRTDIAQTLQIAARPSDAIALALLMQAPLYMESSVFEKLAIFENQLDQTEREGSATRESILETLMKEFDELVKEDFTHVPPYLKKDPIEERVGLDETKPSLLSHREVLQQMLKTAITKEDYERAAEIKKEIDKL